MAKKEKLNLQGGFSIDVAGHPTFQKYTSFPWCGGYIGDSNRTRRRDEVVEYIFRKEHGLGAASIADWLTSTSARHMMDDVSKRTTLSEFKKRVLEYSENAFIDLAVWNHPEFKGSLSSSMELRFRLKSELESKPST